MEQQPTRKTNDSGAAAVELALVLPLLVLLLLGIIEFGRAYNARVTLTAAVREGARALALDSGDPVTVTLDAATGLDRTRITVTPGACIAGQPASVSANYQLDYGLPFFGAGTWDISATGVMRCGG